MRGAETAGTLYGLMQTWPASPQAPQVGSLVPHHIGFDVTTPSGSIFEAAILCPSWQTHFIWTEEGFRLRASLRRIARESWLGRQRACDGCQLQCIREVKRSSGRTRWLVMLWPHLFLEELIQTLLQVKANMHCYAHSLSHFSPHPSLLHPLPPLSVPFFILPSPPIHASLLSSISLTYPPSIHLRMLRIRIAFHGELLRILC